MEIHCLERTLTHLDHVRLKRLMAREEADPRLAPVLAALDELISCSDLVAPDSVPPDVVTMYSQVLLADPSGDAPGKITLCYPEDAEPAQGFISVLSPVGCGLLGLRVGDVARWQGPRGLSQSARVTTMLFQPEATGDYTL